MLAASLALSVPPALGKRVPNDSVTSQKIKNRQVKKRDLARGAVTRRSIVPGAVDGTNVLDRALHGVDIDRNSLQGSEVDETSLDFNVLQARLSGGCPSGEAIRSVTALGEPTCVDVTGGGLGGDLSGPLGGDLTGSLPNPLIALGAVNTAKLADDAVTSAKVPLNELGGSDILESSLSGANISGVDAATVDGANATDFLGAAATAGGDLGGTFANLQLGNNVVGTDEVSLNALGTADIDESNLSGAAISGVDAATVDGANASDFLGASSSAGGDLAGTFSNLQLGTGSVGTSEVDSSLTAADIADTSTLGGPEINEGNLSGASITGVDAATIDGANATDFLGATAAASGDLAGNFPNPTIGPNAVGTSEVDSSLTAADIADTSTLGGPEINESNLSGLVQGTGQVVRGTLNATGATAAGTDVVGDLPGFGGSDIEVGTCTPDALLPAATLRFDNSSGASALVWEHGSVTALLAHASVASGVQEALGSAVGALLDSDELLDIYLYRADTGASARVTIAESTDASNCRFVVEATTSS